MRVGGFVLFRDNHKTLGAALHSLSAVCDVVVAVDTGSSDGSGTLAREAGATVLETAWRGYGEARALAAQALAGCDYLFYLDSDERLGARSREALLSWKQRATTRPSFRVRLHDWVSLGNKRFLYRTGTRHRLVRADCARWRPEMIVHESLELPPAPVLPVTVEHAFITPVNARAMKDQRYAFLWALRAYCQGRKPKLPQLERWALTLRDLFLKGALCRGGFQAASIAWGVSRYHERKHEYLRALRRGEHGEALDAYLSGRLGALFERCLPP
jgi:glycosyltransferase involved in cell wall biosynthesis